MSNGVKVTRELIEAVIETNKKYPMLSQEDLAKLVGTSAATVQRVLAHKYDYMLTDTDTPQETDLSEVITLLKENNKLLRDIIEMWRND